MSRPYAKKSLGQNFLVDKHAIQEIVAEVPSDTDLLLEIGPGRAALSTYLVHKSPNFCLLEKDEQLLPEVCQILQEESGQKVISWAEDALDFDYRKIWEVTNSSANLVVVSNLPYNVATEIFFRLFEFRHKIDQMILMFQKEVADRIIAEPGKKAFAAISILAQIYFEIRSVRTLGPEAFSPRPKIDSKVLNFRRREQALLEILPEEMDSFSKLLHACFAHRRKNIFNSISLKKELLVWKKMRNPDSIRNMLENCRIPQNARAEQLTIEQFGQLFQECKRIGKD